MRFLFPIVLMSGALCAQTAQQQSSQEMLEKTKAAAKAAVEQQNKGGKQAQPGQAAKPPAAAAKPPAAAPQAPAPQANIMAMNPTDIIATVDGKPVPAGELQAIIGTLGPEVQGQAAGNIRAVLEQYGVTKRLAAAAEKNKLDQASPYKDVLEVSRIRILAQAQLSHFINTEISVPEQDIKAAYEKEKANFNQAKVKAIYIPFSSSPAAQPPDPKAPKPMTEAEAKAKADEAVKLARSGTDFVKLVKEYSKDPNSVAKDGDFGVVARNDSSIPEPVKAAIFSGKPGSVTEALRQPNGFYIFRVEEITTPPLDQVRPNLVEQIKNMKFSEWIQQQQREVKIEGLTLSAAPQQQPQAQAAK